MIERGPVHDMIECKHGLKSGCVYCHGAAGSSSGRRAPPAPKKRTSSRLADKMNDRMTALKRRLREVRGE